MTASAPGDPHAEERARLRALPRQRPSHIVRPGPGQVSVWDFPRPPRVEPVPLRVRVELGGQTIVDTTAALRVCETSSPPAYYVPSTDIVPVVSSRASARRSVNGRESRPTGPYSPLAAVRRTPPGATERLIPGTRGSRTTSHSIH